MDSPRTERERIEADAAYWNELADLLGWRLHGFTFRDHASFQTRGMSLASINGIERDDILRVARLQSTDPSLSADQEER